MKNLDKIKNILLTITIILFNTSCKPQNETEKLEDKNTNISMEHKDFHSSKANELQS